MDYSRRETLAVGGGAAAGLLVGGLAGCGVRRSDGPDRRIVVTRGPADADAACEAVRGEKRGIDLGDRRTLVGGRPSDDAVDDLHADHAVDDVEPDPRCGRRRPRVDGRTVTFRGSLPERGRAGGGVVRRPDAVRSTVADLATRAAGRDRPFEAAVRLRRYLSYAVEDRTAFPNGTTVVGDRPNSPRLGDADVGGDRFPDDRIAVQTPDALVEYLEQ